MRLADLCAVPDCITRARPGTFRCSRHPEPINTERRDYYSYTCSLCGRDESKHLTEAEVKAMKPERCSHDACGGRMLLIPQLEPAKV